MFGCTTYRLGEKDFFQPDHRIADALHSPAQTVDRSYLNINGKKIHVTRISETGNKTTLLYCGGNKFRVSVFGGDIVEALPEKVNLVLFDYPGYGESSGAANFVNFKEAALTVYDRFVAKTTPETAVYGTSLGGFVAAYVTGARNPDKLILDATAPSTRRWADSFIPWYADLFVNIDLAPNIADLSSVAYLSEYRGPVLMLVGSKDTQTPPSLMKHMENALQSRHVNARLTIINGRGHGGVMQDKSARRILSNFLMHSKEEN